MDINNVIAADFARRNAYQSALDYTSTPEFKALLGFIYAGIREKSLRGEGVGVFNFTRFCTKLGRSPMLVANALQLVFSPLGYKLEFRNIVKFGGLFKRYVLLLFWGAGETFGEELV